MQYIRYTIYNTQYSLYNIQYIYKGNKIDEPNDRQVSYEEGSTYAQSNGLLFMEASAKTNIGIAQLFDETIRKALDDPTLISTSIATRLEQTAFGPSKCC